jgi:hypothetical protein
LLLILPAPLSAQYQPPAQSLLIAGREASTWTQDRANVVQLEGPVRIELDKTVLTARQAVVWLEGVADGQPGEESVTVALLGEAKIQQPQATRSGDRLLVTARVNGPVRITAESRLARDLSASPTFQAARSLRSQTEMVAQRPPLAPIAGGLPPTTSSAATQPVAAPHSPVRFHSDEFNTITTSDGNMGITLSGNVVVTRVEANGDYLEMQSERAVLFTTLARLSDIKDMQQLRSTEDAITAAYLEGDVRFVVTPGDVRKRAEQRMQANRVYYEFNTDRAVLTDAVMHTIDVTRQVPVIVRAQTLRQLANDEFTAEKAELTTSTFAVPSYSARADRIYIRREPSADPRAGDRTTFSARNITLNAYRVPFFYFPVLGGSVTDHGLPLRQLSFGQSTNFGTSIETEWGLMETLGIIPPSDLDISYKLDYYSKRGPAGGIDATYGGGVISETTKQAWNFKGDFKSYFVSDTGVDKLGRRRGEVDPEDVIRGRVLWQHQHFFPDDWQLQLRSGWVSDATFREEWFEDEFNDGLPLETALYLKHQHDTEAVTFLATVQPNNVVTSADFLQEQFEIERLPQIGYRRIGDSFANDHLTFFSDNTLERVRFNQSGANLGEQGFRFRRDVRPGRPSLGLVGVSGLDGAPEVGESFTTRGDFRQEVDYPFSLGEFRVVPYVMGRYTGYSDTPDGGRADRLFAGTGVRINTAFWNINNNARSELFDIHRIRHIIEPEVHLFTSATNIDPNELWIYDEPIDNIHDVSAMQLALRQRWQTKRGGPGRERSVDVFALNVEANLYANQPSAPELAPLGFRGLFFTSIPEASIPRNSINADAQYRVSDTTILLGDAQYNLDEGDLATASVGLIARRDSRLAYFIGVRYIEALNSAIGTIATSYEITRKYSVGLRQSYDFSDAGSVYSSATLQRRFDRYTMSFSVYNNSTDGQSGFGFGIYPEGLGFGASSDTMQSLFGGQR